VRFLLQHDLINAPLPGFEVVESRIFSDIREAIEAVRWPKGNKGFVIYPEKEANGVKPIKEGFVKVLEARGWRPEYPFPLEEGKKQPGKIDVALELSTLPPFVVEWETGNISSSHRALNKMALGLLKGAFSGAVLVVPSRKLYKFLTDRIGNVAELEPYFGMWSAIPAKGYLGVIVVEHDGESLKVPKIGKGTDGRALV